MFKKQPTDNQLIFMTTILVALLAFPTYRSLTEEPLEGVSVTKADARVQSGRSPASIASEIAQIKSALSSPLKTLDLNCSVKKSSFSQISGHHLQLQGKYCLKNFTANDVEILNQTNGFTASFFPRGLGSYQTDLIQLEPGENRILIRYKQSSGKFVEELLKIQAAAL